LGDNLREDLKKLTFFLNKASTECIILLLVLLYNIYFMLMIVHLRVGVGWKLVALRTPLQEYLVYPHDGFRTIEWLCLV
jgi:hypothetical protein